jgi:hypothetical protein
MAMDRLMKNKRVRNIRKKVSAAMPAARRRRLRRQRISLFAAGSAAGALLAYLFDPDRGRGRRKKALDRVAGGVRRVSRKTGRFARHVASDAQGMARRVRARGEAPPENDAVLVSKVESEVFRGTDFPKESINVNAENGVVVLRGQVEHPRDIRRLEKAVRRIAGVRDVENLLHLPGTPAPTRSDGHVGAGRT